MNFLILPTLLACLATMMHSSHAVIVKVGDTSYPLEAVKKLRELLVMHLIEDISEKDGVAKNPLEDAALANHPQDERMPVVDPDSSAVCNHPQLPKDFHSVCQEADAPLIFSRLMVAIRDTDLCEVCASAACAGC